MNSNIVDKLKFKMFNDQNIKFSCIAQNGAGDTIFRMMRDDAPNNAIQQHYAEEICKAVNNYDSLLEALKKAKDIMTTYNLMNSLAGSYVEEAIQKAEQ